MLPRATPALTFPLPDIPAQIDLNDFMRRCVAPRHYAGISSGMQSVGKGARPGRRRGLRRRARRRRHGPRDSAGSPADSARGSARRSRYPSRAPPSASRRSRGALTTPRKPSWRPTRGKRSDSHRRVWVAEDLVQNRSDSECSDDDILEKARERAKARGEARARGCPGGGGAAVNGGGVASTEYYDALEVAPSATPAEIKRPITSSPGNFTRIRIPTNRRRTKSFSASARRIRCSAMSHCAKKYDERGKDGLKDHAFVDPSAFFAMLFGSDQMEGLVGRLQLATLAAAGADLTKDERRLLQERRVGRLAVKLVAILQGYVDAAGDDAKIKSLEGHIRPDISITSSPRATGTSCSTR